MTGPLRSVPPIDSESGWSESRDTASDSQTTDGGSAERSAAAADGVAAAAPYRQRLLVRTGDRYVFVRTEAIEWIESAGNYVRLHVGSQAYLLRQALSRVDTMLDPRRFVRIHRSAIVNLDCVEELRPLFSGDYQVGLRDGTRLTLSRTFRHRIPELDG